ncbi:transcriptional regulator, TetR family [Paenibacillus algorifonticola]|uniref:Transcriptional regulator, TetR family n=1 Tax=Paenibacillus algorifonticola TaxID=684063 RepID=A0A1I2HGX4_9BACL|nr:TetR/AcrR family transcriptional regulator [Paenibacillus algorifonticola]SFF28909.1 transcriptional regulator, TetR family [Paenibacillus algorifonticola]
MAMKKEQRSEETKRSIIAAAAKLFAARGYESVSIREIAKEAGCSHTTIYIYFEDKEALLHALSMQPLEELHSALTVAAQAKELTPSEQLQRINRLFIQFCLEHRSMYTVFFEAKSIRVDEQSPQLAINELRNQMFATLMGALQRYLDIEEGEALLRCSRTYFYMLRGIIGTYALSEESQESIINRLSDTFDDAFEALLLGLKIQLGKGAM